MRHVAEAALLGLAVLGAWIAAAAFVRLRTAYDRLHCVTYLNAAAGLPLLIATFVADGFSDRFFKLLIMVVFTLLSGAAIGHAVGRAMLLRERR